MKVAILHHWLVRMRGGERVLEAIAGLYPEADLYTLVCDPARLSEPLRSRAIRTSWLQALPGATRLYPKLVPLHPLASQSWDLRVYDLVISVDGALVKDARISLHARHVCYCLTPPRWLWDMADLYLTRAGPVTRAAAAVCFPWLRHRDREAAARVDDFIACSEHVRRRIRRNYGRESTVIYPPVAAFEPAAEGATGDGYLVVGQLVPYKRVDVAVAACARLGLRLTVIGEGPERPRLERLGGGAVEFLGWQDDAVVRQRLRSCRALLFPGEEDFGIAPVEAQMAGRPVIAFRRGGALETVVEGETGLFFDRQTPEALAEAIGRFERAERNFSTAALHRHAMRFGVERFRTGFAEFMSGVRAALP